MRVVHLRAENPGPFTLEGTNSYVVADADGTWVVDPGPALPEHLDAVAAAVAQSGSPWRGVLLTHDHADHVDGVAGLLVLTGAAQVHAARGDVDVVLADGDRVGPFTVVATPGHAPDHLAFVAGPELFSGDAVLGRGSVFVWPSPGALRGYQDALGRLQQLELTRLHPGHGPDGEDAQARIAELLAHRSEREERLVAALAAGHRTVDALLDAAWSDVPAVLRPAAAVTLAAHLDKLAEEDRLPAGVERPTTGGGSPAEPSQPLSPSSPPPDVITPMTTTVRSPSAGEATQVGAIPLVGHATRSRALHVPKLEPGEYLAIEDGGEVVVVALDQEVTHIGRAFSADIRLEAAAVSRRHALVVRDGDVVCVLDDRSGNGVWLDGERVERATLKPGDRFTVGGITLQYVCVPEPAVPGS